MKFPFHNLFKRNKNALTIPPKDVMQIPRTIEPLLNKIAFEIVERYRDDLLSKPVTYIVPAIWGAQEGGTLDSIQEDIFLKVSPTIEQIHKVIGIAELNANQRFSVGYLVKGLIISKITFMLEVLKNRLPETIQLDDPEKDSLEHLEPMGTA